MHTRQRKRFIVTADEKLRAFLNFNESRANHSLPKCRMIRHTALRGATPQVKITLGAICCYSKATSPLKHDFLTAVQRESWLIHEANNRGFLDTTHTLRKSAIFRNYAAQGLACLF